MHPRHAFSRADLLAAVVVIVTLVGVTHVLLGEDSKVSTRTRESLLKARGIHSGLVLYSQGNLDYYPGLTSRGEVDKTKLEARDKIVAPTHRTARSRSTASPCSSAAPSLNRMT